MSIDMKVLTTEIIKEARKIISDSSTPDNVRASRLKELVRKATREYRLNLEASLLTYSSSALDLSFWRAGSKTNFWNWHDTPRDTFTSRDYNTYLFSYLHRANVERLEIIHDGVHTALPSDFLLFIKNKPKKEIVTLELSLLELFEEWKNEMSCL